MNKIMTLGDIKTMMLDVIDSYDFDIHTTMTRIVLYTKVPFMPTDIDDKTEGLCYLIDWNNQKATWSICNTATDEICEMKNNETLKWIEKWLQYPDIIDTIVREYI